MNQRSVWKSVLVSGIVLALAVSMLPACMPASDVMPEPDYVIGGDMIVSYDEPDNINNALHPSVAVSPPGSPKEGTIHVVWDEYFETGSSGEILPGDLREIFYSKSDDGGITWSNDLHDVVISDPQREKAINNGNSRDPSIAVDSKGFIHVVWAEQMDYDGSWEIFYSRSTDNGETWSSILDPETGNIRISRLRGDGSDATEISAPKMVAGLSKDGADVLYVVWSEFNDKVGRQLHFSKSHDGGQFWTGMETDIMAVPGESAPLTPDIVATGDFAQFVHVAWSQMAGNELREIFYSASYDFGDQGTWRTAKPISFVEGDFMAVQNITMAGDINGNLHVLWSQMDLKNPEFSEMFYSGSDSNGEAWTGTGKDTQISFFDGAPVVNPSVGAGDKKVQVVWTELDQESPKGTMEIHTSWSDDPLHGAPWSGIEMKDIVLSNGDDWGPADARNVSMEMGLLKGSWEPVLVWDELNDEATKDRAERNNEIHTEPLPEWTLSVSVSGSGSVAKNPDQSTYEDGTWVTLTASAAAGWRFDHWEGDLSGSTNPNSIQMDADKSVTAYFTQNIYFRSLAVGWNMVSLPYIQSDTSVTTVLSSISGSYNSVKYFNALDKADPWKSYRPGGTVNDLTNINHRMAIWIKATSACTLTVYGDIPTSTTIPLYTGWNFVGYPSQTSRLASVTLPSVADIVSVSSAVPPFITDYTDKTLVTMSQGNGYWVRVTSDTTWVVNW